MIIKQCVTKDREVPAKKLVIKDELKTEFPSLYLVYSSDGTVYYATFLESLRETFVYGSLGISCFSFFKVFPYDDNKTWSELSKSSQGETKRWKEVDKLLEKYRQESLPQTAAE